MISPVVGGLEAATLMDGEGFLAAWQGSEGASAIQLKLNRG